MPQTGPRTTEGKAIVARNAVRSGLYAAPSLAVGDEAPGDWARFHQEIVEDRAPEGPLEIALASRVAILLWRLRRVPRAESAAVKQRIANYADDDDDDDDGEEETDEGAAGHGEYAEGQDAESGASASLYSYYPTRRPRGAPPLLPHERDLAVLVRVEAHLNRQLMQTLHELEALQSRRRGTPSPLSRVDVHGLGGI